MTTISVGSWIASHGQAPHMSRKLGQSPGRLRCPGSRQGIAKRVVALAQGDAAPELPGDSLCSPPFRAWSLPAALSSSWRKCSSSAGMNDAAAAECRWFPRPCTPSLALSPPCCFPLCLPMVWRKPQPVPLAGGSVGSIAWRNSVALGGSRLWFHAVISGPCSHASVSLCVKGEG